MFSDMTLKTEGLQLILFVALLLIGIIAAVIGFPPLTIIIGYGVIGIIPLGIVLLKKDLINGLFAWFLLVLFSESIGEIHMPMIPDVSPHRSMWIILFLFFLVELAFKERFFLPITKVETFMIIFCFVCLFSMIKAGTLYLSGEGLSLRDFLNGYAIPFSIYYLAKHIIDNEQKVMKLFRFLSIIGIYLALTALFEHFNFIYLIFPRSIMDPNIGIHYGRARGPFFQAAVNGTVLGMIFITSIYYIISKRKKVTRSFLAMSICLIPVAIFFTYTRAAWMGFIFTLLIPPIFYPKLRKILYLSLILIIIIAMSNWTGVISEDRTVGGVTAKEPVYARLNLYATSFDMFLDKPLFGFGFNTFKSISPEYFRNFRGFRDFGKEAGSHDSLITILVELGLFGFLPFLLIFYYIFKHSIRLYRKLASNNILGKGLIVTFWGASIVYLVNIQLIEMRYFQFPNSLFFLLSGIIVGFNQRFTINNRYFKKAY